MDEPIHFDRPFYLLKFLDLRKFIIFTFTLLHQKIDYMTIWSTWFTIKRLLFLFIFENSIIFWRIVVLGLIIWNTKYFDELLLEFKHVHSWIYFIEYSHSERLNWLILTNDLSHRNHISLFQLSLPQVKRCQFVSMFNYLDQKFYWWFFVWSWFFILCKCITITLKSILGKI